MRRRSCHGARGWPCQREAVPSCAHVSAASSLQEKSLTGRASSSALARGARHIPPLRLSNLLRDRMTRRDARLSASQRRSSGGARSARHRDNAREPAGPRSARARVAFTNENFADEVLIVDQLLCAAALPRPRDTHEHGKPLRARGGSARAALDKPAGVSSSFSRLLLTYIKCGGVVPASVGWVSEDTGAGGSS